MQLKKLDKIFMGFLLVMYFLLLIPYLVISSVYDNGIIENGVIESAKIVPYQSFQKAYQDILKYNDDYNLIVIKNINSPEKTAILFLGEQYSKGEFIKIEDITMDLFIDPHDASFTDVLFNKMIIGKVSKVEYGGDIIEFLTANRLMSLINISKLVFYIGGLLIIVVISLKLSGTLEMWNIPAVLSSYSFQFFILNILSMLNQRNVIAGRLTQNLGENLALPFGYLFILFIPITVIVKRYENTDNGKQLILKIYQSHLRLIKKFFPLGKSH